MIPLNPIIGAAVANAARRTSPRDAAAAILAGLRLIRSTVNEQGGYASAAALDDAIREILLAERLRQRSIAQQAPEPTALPPPSGSHERRIATAIIEDVAGFCIGLQASMPAGSILELAVGCLVAQLVERLGGVPETEALLSAIRDPAEADDLPAEGSGFTVVRIH